MSAIIREIFWQEYDTATLIRSVRADIICDAIADLPSGGIMTDYKLDIGSRAKVIADGSEWEIQSSGSWVRQPSRMQLDLTGYATTQDLADGLAAKVDTAAYTAGQAAQDAVINTKITAQDVYGIGLSLASGDSMDALPCGRFTCVNAATASGITNSPWTDGGFFGWTFESIQAGNRFVQIAIKNVDTFTIAKRRYSGVWSPWVYAIT